MCTNFGFNLHPEKPCALEQEWASVCRRLLSYLLGSLHVFRQSAIREWESGEKWIKGDNGTN